MGGVPAQYISTPVFGQVQLAVDESMSQRGDKGKEDTDLAVFHTPGAPAILGGDTSGVAAAFGEAAFVNDKHRPERLGGGTDWHQGRRVQALADPRTAIVAGPALVPEHNGEETLHSHGPGLPR